MNESKWKSPAFLVLVIVTAVLILSPAFCNKEAAAIKEGGGPQCPNYSERASISELAEIALARQAAELEIEEFKMRRAGWCKVLTCHEGGSWQVTEKFATDCLTSPYCQIYELCSDFSSQVCEPEEPICDCQPTCCTEVVCDDWDCRCVSPVL